MYLKELTILLLTTFHLASYQQQGNQKVQLTHGIDNSAGGGSAYIINTSSDLSLVTDAHSRKIMGYHLSDDMSAENVVKALKMVFKERQSTQPLIHHSDRGLQYCSSLYQQQLNKHNVTPSMTDGYDCYQNALAERINGILKQEFLTETCNTGQELELLIKESIEVYNNYRSHLSLQMKTPNFIHAKTEENYSLGLN